MEAIDYIKLFKLDQENYEFNREEFLQEFSKEFLEYCQETPIGRDHNTGNIKYYRFKEIVKNFQGKFWAISDLKVGKPLTKGLWNAFFATTVVPVRAKLFPASQLKIQELIKNRSQQDKSSSTNKKANYDKGNPRPSRQ